MSGRLPASCIGPSSSPLRVFGLTVDASRGSDDDLDTLAEDADVIAHEGATDTRVRRDVEEVAESAGDLLDLLGQLAGRGEDQSLALVLLQVDRLEDGDREGSGLTWRARKGEKETNRCERRSPPRTSIPNLFRERFLRLGAED